MIKNLLLLLLVIINFTTFAQIQFRDSICQNSFSQNDTVYLENEVPYKYQLYNGNGNQINCKLEIIELSLPANSGYLTMCANNSCLLITAPRTIFNSQTIAANSCATDLKDIEYSQGNATDNLFLRLKATNLSNANDTATLCFIYPAPSTGINILGNAQIAIFPNPANDFIFINIKENKSKIGQIFNINGQIIATFIINNPTKVNISNLQKGIYFVKTENNIQKFVKQ